MMIVSNTSPLIFLSKIEKLTLLQKQFGTITVPEAVLDEIKEKQVSPEMRYFDSHATLFQIINPKKVVLTGLGAGEAEAIALAIEHKASLLIIDDHLGRLAAEKAGIPVIGTLGLLLFFLKKGEIDYAEFKGLINQLIESGFRMSIELYEQVIGEAEKIKI